MEGINCQICSLEFDDSNIIPKVLECGHSLCSPCLDKLINTKQGCPVCRKPINGTCANHSTNYALLGIINAKSSYNLMKPHVACRLQLMKTKFTAKRDNLNKQKTEINAHLEEVKSMLLRIEQLGKDDEEYDVHDINMAIRDLESNFQKLGNGAHPNYQTIRMTVSLSLSSFENSAAYLDEIYRLSQERNQIYSVAKVEDTIRYGRITTENNLLLIHALDLQKIPKGQTSVWFDEFKKCMNGGPEFRGFLKISCNAKSVSRLVRIKFIDSQLLPQFVKLCTGECGPTYKGCPYIKGGKPGFFVEKYVKDGNKNIGNIDYGMNSNTRPYQSSNCKAVLQGFSSGAFSIVNNTYGQLTDIIGEVTEPSNLEELIDASAVNNLEILDCGFLFEY